MHFHLTLNEIITFIVSLFSGGGVGYLAVKTFMRTEAKSALKDDLDIIYAKINNITKEYVTCRLCNAQHNALNTTLFDINKKLDLLLEKALGI